MFSLLPTLSLTLRTTAPRLSAAPSSALLPPDATPVNFWLLADRDADLTEDDAAVGAYWQSLRAKDAAETERCLAQLMERPIAVEFELPTAASEVFSWSEGEAAEEIGAGGQRTFLLPGGVGAVRIDETDSESGGLGHGVWDAAIGLALWLASDPEGRRVRGQSVLELGSGVGLGGISAARAGASRVTLSDVAADADADAERRAAAELGGRQLLQRLGENSALNGVADSTSTLALDWADCVADAYRPAEQYPLVLGADVVHEMYGVDALAAAVAKHTRPGGGAAYLLSTQGRPGLDQLPAALRAAAAAAAAAAAGATDPAAAGPGGSGGCELEERQLTVYNSHGKADVVLTTFRRE